MDCPQCGKQLSTVPTSQGRGLQCCGACCGVWFSKDELSRYLFDSQSGPQAEKQGEEQAGPRVMLHPDKAEGFCLTCNRVLELHPVMGTGCEIQVCYQCGGCFVEYDQLTLLEKWYPGASPTAKTSLIISKPDTDDGISSDSFLSSIAGKIEDENPVRDIPWFTLTLIAANVVCFLITTLYPEILKAFYLTPKHYIENINSDVWPVLFCAFGHADPWHLLGNMYFLFVFGDNIEDRIGRPVYSGLYFFCALASSGSHVLIFNQSVIPMIGASGAISGIMGAYLFLYPRVKIRVFSTLYGIPLNVRLPAWVYLLVWFFGSNILFFFLKIPGIAWDAHVTGFVAGYFGIQVLKKARLY